MAFNNEINVGGWYFARIRYLCGVDVFLHSSFRPFVMQDFLEVQKWTLFAPPVCNLSFELPCTTVESYERLYVKTSVSLLSYYTDTTRITYDTR